MNAQAKSRSQPEGSTWERAAFWTLLALQVALVWVFPFVPAQDGPSHVYNAVILLNYHQPWAVAWREHYVLAPALVPNLAGPCLLAALAAALPPLTAEKVLLTIYLVGFPLGFRHAARALAGGESPALLLVFPFVTSRMFHLGFHSFCLSLAVLFALLAYWWPRRMRRDARALTGMALGALALYACHLITLMLGFGALTVITLAQQRATWPRHAAMLLAWLPALALGVWFLASSPRLPAAETTILERLAGVIARLALLASLSVVQSHVEWEAPFAYALAITIAFAIAAAWRQRTADSPRGVGWATLALCAVTLVAPAQTAEGAYIIERVALLALLFGILWLSTRPLPDSVRLVVPAAAFLLSLGWVGAHGFAFHRINESLTEFVSLAPHLEPGRTLDVFHLRTRGRLLYQDPTSLRTEPLLHAADHLARERRLVDLDNYEAHERYFPVQFRPDRRPGPRLMPADSLQPHARPDYVIVWGHEPATQREAITRHLQQRGYRLAATTQPTAAGGLWSLAAPTR